MIGCIEIEQQYFKSVRDGQCKETMVQHISNICTKIRYKIEKYHMECSNLIKRLFFLHILAKGHRRSSHVLQNQRKCSAAWTVGRHAQYSWQRLSATILELGAQLKACWNSSTWARALLTLEKEHSNRLQHLQSETALFWQITDFSLYCTICVMDLRVLDIWRGIIAFVTVWLWRKTTSTPETIANKKTSFFLQRVEDKGGEMWSTEGWRGCRTQTDGR